MSPAGIDRRMRELAQLQIERIQPYLTKPGLTFPSG